MHSRRFAHLIRFAFVGLIGAILQLTLLYIFKNRFGVATTVATPLAVELTILHNFVWHHRYTWNDRAAASLRQQVTRLWRFHIANGLISLAGNTVLLYALVQRWELPLVPSAITAIAACSLANFLLADRWIYTPTPS